MARLDLPVGAGRRVVVPVPTTAARLRERGYNQAALLADGVGRGLGLPVYDALERGGSGRSQTALAPAERRENVRGACRARRSAARPVAGAHVLLIDDVLTTGATAAEAASALTETGATAVTLVTFARALPGRARRAA
jgi:ComF family protein